MKYVAFFLFVGLIGCSEDDPEPKTKCMTGINQDGARVMIRCATQQQFNAGSNVSAGGTAQWDLYTQHKLEECGQCK
jgi:hypothetical protein